MPPVTAASTLAGRDEELALLDGLLRKAARGRGCAVLVDGEPGIGKSALVHAAVASAPEAGCQVFWGAGDELGQALPLLPFLDALRVLEAPVTGRRKTIAGLLRGEIAAEGGMDVPSVLCEQLLALVTEQCAVRPAVLVIDNLHWADQASIALWGRLARSASRMPLLLIGITRPAAQRQVRGALRRAVSDTARLHLTGLTGEAVASLVAALAGGTPEDSLLELAGGAAGNPLYLTELVAALARDSSLIITDTGTARLAGDPAPGSVPAAIAGRLDFVAGPVREVLRAAAMLGSDFAVSDLAVVLGRSVADLIPAVDEACAVGILAEAGDGLGFRHPLIGAALYDETPASARPAWHRDAAHALAAAAAAADRVARQMLRATGEHGAVPEPMDEWMLDWLSAAADELVAQAPGVAAKLLTLAVAASPVAPARRSRLAGHLADALYRTGDRPAAEQVAMQALEQATDPDLVVDLHWMLAQCRLLPDQAQESLAALDRALSDPGLSARHRARLLVTTARTHSNLGEPGMARQAAASALDAASEAADTWATAWALFIMALGAPSRGRGTDALPLYDQALAATHSDPALSDLRLLVQIHKAAALGSLDRSEEALTVAGQARDLADRAGTAIQLALVHGALAELLYETGHWDAALAEASAQPAEQKEPAPASNEPGVAAVISFHRGEIPAARRYIASAALYGEQVAAARLGGLLALARCMDCEHAGALPEALTALTAHITGSTEEIEDLLGDAVRLAIKTGDVSTAQTFTARAAALAAGSAVPHRLASALYCQGLLDHDAALLLAAADRYRDATRPLLAAKALEAAAGVFLHAGERGRARAAFVQAVDGYSALGAAADVARVQAAFRPHGIHRGPHARHRRADSGWESLTPTEVKVAVLVGEGLSNPDIAGELMLSKRTIDTHVSHILRKLGVTSRTDIAREAALCAVRAGEAPPR
jgi:DNA-binding CsgD family transcriptional regulator